MLEEIPGLKIIHLVRDPRATLTSQSRFGMCNQKYGGQFGCTEKVCSKVEDNIREEKSIAREYPGRIQTLMYEDLASNPIETSKKLFKFIGTTFSKAAEEYIINITMAGNPDGCSICSTRSNSTLHIDKWRTKIKPSFQNIIETICIFVLRRYNYI